MRITPWGVRGSFPVTDENMTKFGGNTTCFEVREHSTPLVIIDAGTGIHNLSLALAESGEAHIFISHFHLDHIQGLPFFKPLFNPNWTIYFYIPKGQKDFLGKIFDGYIFPLTLDLINCKWSVKELIPSEDIKIGALTIKNFIVAHTGICHAFRIIGPKCVTCIINDTEISNKDEADHIQKIITNADMAFIDGHFTAIEYEQYKGLGHTNMEILPDIAIAAKVKKLIICHHSPSHSDAELDSLQQTLRNEHRSQIQVEMAQENISYIYPDNLTHINITKSSLVQWITDFSQELLRYDDLSILLDRILLEARKITSAEAGTIFLESNNELIFAFTHNDRLFHVDNAHKYSYANATLPIDTKSIAGYCAYTRTPLNIADIRKLPKYLPFTFNDSFDRLTKFTTVSMLCIPLIGKYNRLLGIIQLINCIKDTKIVPFTNSLYEKMPILAIQAVHSIEHSLLAKKMVNRMQTLSAMSDPKETDPHVERVGAISAELYNFIAIEQNVPVDSRRVIRGQIRLAAMLHDIGKSTIPNNILKKPGKLSQDEFLIMQTHCSNSKFIFMATHEEIDQMASTIAFHHHQRWDGKGYTGDTESPLLSGEAIPLAARIVAVADVFDALVSVRCYKAAWTWKDAVSIIKKDSGSHFDPAVVNAFLACEDTIKAIYLRYKDNVC